MTAGPGLAAGGGPGEDVLALPSGARGRRLPDGQAVQLLAGLPCWVELAGVCDALLAEEMPGLSPGGRPCLEDGLLSAWLGPFGWLLVAEPADEATLSVLRGQSMAGEFDENTKGIAQVALLTELVSDLDEQESSAFLAEVREQADAWLAQHGHR
jgi:hypothetical protein